MPKLVSGFTLVEMLIAIGIITALSGVVLFNYGSFNSSLALTNLAYDIALTVRQAEYYGIGSKSSEGDFTTGYGVHFDTVQNTTYNIFSVLKEETSYAFLDPNQVVQIFDLNNGNYISSIHKINPCEPVSGNVDVVFFRPLPKVYFSYGGTTELSNGIVVEIKSTRADDKKMYVKILSSGQIGVSKTSECYPS
ncbi:MAG: type II secretion system protein [Candidatus Paceibacterota bacterium]